MGLDKIVNRDKDASGQYKHEPRWINWPNSRPAPHILRRRAVKSALQESLRNNRCATTALSGSADGKATLWNVSTREVVRTPHMGHARGVNCVAFSPDNEHVLTGGVGLLFQGEALLWNAATGAQVGKFPHQAEV